MSVMPTYRPFPQRAPLSEPLDQTQPLEADCSPNVRWQRSALTRERRWESLGCAGATVWFTGLPAAGKSTLASAVEERLVEGGRSAFLLDGDNLRHGLNGDLGFDEPARSENVRRTAHVARLLAESGSIALVSLVSPYAADREAAAALHREAEMPFFEVFVNTPLEALPRARPQGPVRARAVRRVVRPDWSGCSVRGARAPRPRAALGPRNGEGGGRAGYALTGDPLSASSGPQRSQLRPPPATLSLRSRLIWMRVCQGALGLFVWSVDRHRGWAPRRREGDRWSRGQGPAGGRP